MCIRDRHYDENNFYNKKGYKEFMESFSREKNYYKDSLIVKMCIRDRAGGADEDGGRDKGDCAGWGAPARV